MAATEPEKSKTPKTPRPPSAIPPSDEEFRQIFEAFDRDDDGKISEKELVDLLRACGLNPTKTEANKIMLEFDKNLVDGTLEIEECYALFAKHWNSNTERQLVQAFRRLDENKNGYIERKELEKILMNYGDDKLTSEEVTEMIKSADLDMNKLIDYFEFARAIAERPNWEALGKRKQ